MQYFLHILTSFLPIYFISLSHLLNKIYYFFRCLRMKPMFPTGKCASRFCCTMALMNDNLFYLLADIQ